MATFTNQAALTYGGITTLSNIVSGQLRDALSVTKTAVGTTYTTGEAVVYVVSLVNTGTAAVGGITLTDNLGAYPFGTGTRVPLTYVEGSLLYYVNGELVASPTPSRTSPLVIGGISVPAGGNVQLIYAALVNAYAPLGEDGAVTNVVTVDSPSLTSPITATETVRAANCGGLTITKALTPAVVSAGDTLTYTLTIENYRTVPVTAAGGAVVTDTFDPILTLDSVTFNGVAWSAGAEYTYNPATGAFATLPGAVTVPAATVTQDPVSGRYTLTPGVATIVIRGTV